MSFDYTELQSDGDEQQARDLSLRHTQPPTQVPGYDLTRFLGAGAYGEVWIGLDRNTGRQIAIKFYLHRGGVDWSLLSREVEKLVLLSTDRYIVQLLDVGWQSEPPYYVMEFIENGSLEQLIQRDEPRSIDQVVALFREIATGLNHAHAKGILHCDLKPANVLLDRDARPRLADFGQSRLTNEQTPSLGTLFYMAPEQADLEALPDARWDVYALGAILYCLLVGTPPHHNETLLKQIEEAPDLPARLRCYRQWITTRKTPDAHRKVPGVDRALAGIVDRCLQPRSSKRFPNAQSVLDALRTRDQTRARRPLLLLGVLGPLLLLVVMWVFGTAFYDSALTTTDHAVMEKVWQSNRFAAKFVASNVANEIDRYYRAIEQTARNADLHAELTKVVVQLDDELVTLARPNLSDEDKQRTKELFLNDPARRKLQQQIQALYASEIAPLEQRSPPRAVSLFVCGPRGTHLAGAFPNHSTKTIGDNFAYRSYCHGGVRDLQDKDARPMPAQHVQSTSISSPLFSTLNKRWKIAVSTPLFRADDPGQLLGVLVLSVDVGEVVGNRLNVANVDAAQDKDAEITETDLTDFRHHFAMLVDGRNNGFLGMVLDHPMLRERYQPAEGFGEDYSKFRVSPAALDGGDHIVKDPFGETEGGAAAARDWIAASAPVTLQRRKTGTVGFTRDTGLIVFVQEDKDYATRPVRDLGRQLAGKAGLALIGFLSVVGLLWFFVLHLQGRRLWWRRSPLGPGSSIASPTPAHPRSTVAGKTP